MRKVNVISAGPHHMCHISDGLPLLPGLPCLTSVRQEPVGLIIAPRGLNLLVDLASGSHCGGYRLLEVGNLILKIGDHNFSKNC
jgi:hypothetical protein